MKKYLFIFFCLLILPFKSNGVIHISLSPSETSCEDFAEYIEGTILQNAFGGEFEILKIQNTIEESRSNEELVCVGKAKLSNGPSALKFKLYMDNGEIWYQIDEILDFEYDLSAENSQSSSNIIIERSQADLKIMECSSIINDSDRLECYDAINQNISAENNIIIPSFEKIIKERTRKINLGTIFYGCIEDITYDENIFTNEKEISLIKLSGTELDGVYVSADVLIEDFVEISVDEIDLIKIGDCFALEPNYFALEKQGSIYSGGLKINNSSFQVNNTPEQVVLKDEMTTTEFFEHNKDYGNKTISLIGTVRETDGNNSYYKVVLISEKFVQDEINAYFYSENWENDENLKNYLRSIKPGDTVYVKGSFGTMNVAWYYMGFEINEFILPN